MREIAILSGKGGVGKSSIAAALGSLLIKNHKVVLADTDVDTPNLHLLLDAEVVSSQTIAASNKAFIDYSECLNCMLCVEVCKFASITGKKQPVIIPYSCEGCGACVITCPEEAIMIKEQANGRINIFHTTDMVLVSGELYIGASSSGRVVDLVKRRARQEAEAGSADLLLTDGPPGIGCPVIASVKGADYVVAVTEPTPAALHDLTRLVEVIRYLKTPLGIVINKSDIHPESNTAIKRFADNNGFTILVEIPYDNRVSQALMQRKTIVKAYPDSPPSLAIRKLAEKLTNNS